uniref:Uncharacterized protein n=1 Tax=Physcomitrium patens TaxID=3218 RepID=A0A2K1J977_PHYPA|nr:hypothetical protein PHYPA_021178 [Physcomitrium patens]
MAVTLLIGLFYLAKDGAPLRGFMVELQGCTIPWLAPADFRGLTCGEKAWMSHHPLIPLNHDSVLIFTRHSRSYPKISCITLLQPRLLCKGTSQRKPTANLHMYGRPRFHLQLRLHLRPH